MTLSVGIRHVILCGWHTIMCIGDVAFCLYLTMCRRFILFPDLFRKMPCCSCCLYFVVGSMYFVDRRFVFRYSVHHSGGHSWTLLVLVTFGARQFCTHLAASFKLDQHSCFMITVLLVTSIHRGCVESLFSAASFVLRCSEAIAPSACNSLLMPASYTGRCEWLHIQVKFVCSGLDKLRCLRVCRILKTYSKLIGHAAGRQAKTVESHKTLHASMQVYGDNCDLKVEPHCCALQS